ncbi:UNVERIFIED_CONTAM: hypothetical protein HDU68_009077 [Siphonaria sp. JEL0065]|nr:hypothetical protein HDU68_009077 [Siphonaria sp. JEL0065]
MVSVFDDNNQPNTKELKEVAERIGTSLRHVQFWFQNRRAAMRRKGMSSIMMNEGVCAAGSAWQTPVSDSGEDIISK